MAIQLSTSSGPTRDGAAVMVVVVVVIFCIGMVPYVGKCM